MNGPEILARTLSVASARGSSAQSWQYHSRSDAHSKIACWTVLFDLLVECDAMREQAVAGRVGFGINHVMVGPINKTLDLIVTVVPPNRAVRERMSFADLVATYNIRLTAAEAAQLAKLPSLEMDHREDVSEVAIALEAKACMTEHIKSLPRLHAEILATGYLAKKAVPRCIAVSYSLVNSASTFVTPSGEGKINHHTQPEDARRVVEMISQAVPTRTDSKDYGYDVVGITTLECRNDGSPVRVVHDADVAPKRSDHTHYERMIRSVCSEYRSRFGR
jgi:hypothetical protein